jgi:hypothetical protein
MRTQASWWASLAIGLASLASSAGHADTWHPLAGWRIEGGRVAPWAQPGTQVGTSYQGREVRFESSRVVAPHPLACADAKYEWLFGGAEGLFEGNLPAPAEEAARALGLGGPPFGTLRVSCSNAGFDFHRTPAGELLLGLDNVVWRLLPVRPAASAEEIVQELLVAHFTHDMGFTPDSVAAKSAFLSVGLRTRIAAWFATTRAPDEAPAINGDPFTDSQEYPDRFSLGAERTARQRTVVPVNFADGHSRRRVDYLLVREGARWVVEDLVDERGQSLQSLLTGH